MKIEEINARFAQLCKSNDFIEVYNDHTGQNVKELNLSQLFSVGYMFHLVTVKTVSGLELDMTDALYDLNHEGKIYIATGDFLDITTSNEEKEIQNVGLSVKFSNVKTEYINLIRRKELDHAQVDIKMAFVNPTTGLIDNLFPIFSGEVDSINIIVDYKEDKMDISNSSDVKINSIWAALDKHARNHASDSVHRSYEGNEDDLFFSHGGKWNSEAIWRTRKK